MSSTNTCIYPTLDDVSERTLQLYFTPSENELAFCKQYAKSHSQQTCFLVTLKVMKFLYRAPKCEEVPYSIVRQINRAVTPQRFTKAAFTRYGLSGARAKHLNVIRGYLNLKPVTEETQTFLYEAALKTAKTKANPTDIVNASIEYLLRDQFELPELLVIERAARKASTNINDHLYQEISALLSQEQKQRIDALFELPPNHRVTDWHRLKSAPKKPTPKNIRAYLDHLNWLKPLAKDILLPNDLATKKMEAFRDDARSLNAARMKELKSTKRYAIAAILIRFQLADALDNLALIFIRTIQDLESTGKRLFNEHCINKRDQSDQLIGHFHDVLSSFHASHNDSEYLEVAHNQIDPNLDRWMRACDQHMSTSRTKHIPFMITSYRNKRSLIFTCLENLSIQACTGNEDLLKVWRFIQQNKESRSKQIDLHPHNQSKRAFNISWIGKTWHSLLAPKYKRLSNATQVNREYLELCLFCQMKEEMRVGDLYVDNANEYSKDSDQFIDDETLKAELPEYGDLVDLPTQPKAFVKQLRKELRDACIKVDKKFPELEEAWFDHDVLKLKQVRSPKKKKINDALDAQLKKHLDRVSIIDVISDTVNWLDLDRYFQPLSGNKKRIPDPKERLVSSLFCYGCNLGPAQTAECLKGLNRNKISWLNLRHASEKQLKKVIEKVVNVYQKMEIAKYWGDGKSLSADGTHRRTYEDNLFSQFHFRYRKKGMISYFLTSDNYICLFSHFIPCGVHESTYILDGLMDNELDIDPKNIHGDTQAQTLSTFGLSYLLGFNLMPRIRKIKKLKFFKPSDDLKLKNIGRLFKDTINWQLIEDHLPEMYRTAISIKKGIVTPSAILRRAGGRSRKNRRYYAFQELGKVIRTLFLLHYISDYELRQFIQRETNKSEQFNNFVQWVAFHNDGLIAEDLQREQGKIVKYQHLVANLVVLYNAEKMTRALKAINDSGFELTERNMFHLSPFWTSHINRLGDYHLDLDREIEPIDFKFDILKND